MIYLLRMTSNRYAPIQKRVRGAGVSTSKGDFSDSATSASLVEF